MPEDFISRQALGDDRKGKGKGKDVGDGWGKGLPSADKAFLCDGKGEGKGVKGSDGKEPRPGDWNCPGCGAMVFASKKSCFKCHTTRDGQKADPAITMFGPAPNKLAGENWEEPRDVARLPLIGELAPEVAWSYPLKDDSRRSYAGHLKCPLSNSQTIEFFELIREGVDWRQPEGPTGPIPRKTAWMVSKGCSCTYRYGGIEVPPQEYPPFMMEVMQAVMPFFGLKDQAQWPNSCNLNLYTDGGMSVGWHSDDERYFNGKFQDIRILSLSLGVARSFNLRSNWPEPQERQLRSLMLSNGDLCTMEGMLQKHYQHRVPKENNISGPRINLTWRWNVRHEARCPAGRMRC